MSYTIIIPTMWKTPDLLKQMVRKYNDCELVNQIVIVDNDTKHQIALRYEKVFVIGEGKNLFVNPSWNKGIEFSTSEKVILANDDIIIDNLDTLLVEIDKVLKPGVLVGVNSHCYKQRGLKVGNLTIERTDGPMCYGFGVFMAMYRESYEPIPVDLKVWYGDELLHRQLIPYEIKGIEVQTLMGQTSKTLNLSRERISEKVFYAQWLHNFNKTPKTVMLVFKQGGDFKMVDVLLLSYHLHKNYSNLKVYCLTDACQIIHELRGVTLLPLSRFSWPGWWSKMNLFSPELDKYRPFLFVDLDTAIVNRLNEFFPKNEKQFVMLEDFYWKGKAASGVMWFPKDSEKVKLIWKRWIMKPIEWIKAYRGDQDFIRAMVRPDEFWQRITNKIFTFKPKRNGWLSEIPYDASIICFHGNPRIFKASEKIKWVNSYIKEFKDG